MRARKLGARRPVWLIFNQPWIGGNFIQVFERAMCAMQLGDSESAIDSGDRGSAEREQRVIKLHDGGPIGLPRVHANGMGGLDGGFKLIAADYIHGAGAVKERLSLGNHFCIPQRWVLLREWDVVAFRVAARGTSGFSVQHEGQKAETFRFVGSNSTMTRPR